MPSLMDIKQRLQTEIDEAVTKASLASGPVEKREWLAVADQATATIERIVMMGSQA